MWVEGHWRKKIPYEKKYFSLKAWAIDSNQLCWAIKIESWKIRMGRLEEKLGGWYGITVFSQVYRLLLLCCIVFFSKDNNQDNERLGTSTVSYLIQEKDKLPWNNEVLNLTLDARIFVRWHGSLWIIRKIIYLSTKIITVASRVF